MEAEPETALGESWKGKEKNILRRPANRGLKEKNLLQNEANRGQNRGFCAAGENILFSGSQDRRILPKTSFRRPRMAWKGWFQGQTGGTGARIAPVPHRSRVPCRASTLKPWNRKGSAPSRRRAACRAMTPMTPPSSHPSCQKLLRHKVNDAYDYYDYY